MVQLALFPLVSAPDVRGDSELVPTLIDVVRSGFPGRPDDVPEVWVAWNGRLRSTVGRTIYGADDVVIELSPSYHAAHPGELTETLAHEYAHVLHPTAGHNKLWRGELEQALRRLRLPVRPNLACAAHCPPSSGRYQWTCPRCGAVVATRSRRRRDEVASYSNCCRERVVVFDVRQDETARPRPHQVCCRRCETLYVAYDDPVGARRFARGHRCSCGGRLRTRELFDDPTVGGSRRQRQHEVPIQVNARFAVHA